MAKIASVSLASMVIDSAAKSAIHHVQIVQVLIKISVQFV